MKPREELTAFALGFAVGTLLGLGLFAAPPPRRRRRTFQDDLRKLRGDRDRVAGDLRRALEHELSISQ
jgi:hypothetical protein